MPTKILMVDDEPDILKIIKYRLVKLGYEVLFASNGKEGVEMARAHKPQLIIMDYRMPLLNGLEAMKVLRMDDDLKNVPIILMSASSESINDAVLKEAGIDAFLGKPFEAEELLNKMKRLLNTI